MDGSKPSETAGTTETVGTIGTGLMRGEDYPTKAFNAVKCEYGKLSTFVRQAHPFALTAKVVGASKFPDLSIAIERVDAGSQSVPVVRAGRCDLDKLCSFFHCPSSFR